LPRWAAEKAVGFALGCWLEGDIIRTYMRLSGQLRNPAAGARHQQQTGAR